MKQIILTHTEIEQKLNRLAFQVIENTFNIPTIYFAGIQGNGFMIAQKIQKIISKHTDQKIVLCDIKLNKEEPLSQPITLSIPEKDLINQTIILIDDVINSGKTMQYALIKLLQQPLREVYTVTLIDRKHRRFPVKANFFGLRLSTTLQNHVAVSLQENNYSVHIY